MSLFALPLDSTLGRVVKTFPARHMVPRVYEPTTHQHDPQLPTAPHPSFQRPLALPVTEQATEGVLWQVPRPPSGLLREENGEEASLPSRRPSCQRGPCLVSHSGHGRRTGSELPPQRRFCSVFGVTRWDLFGGTWLVRAGWPETGA